MRAFAIGPVLLVAAAIVGDAGAAEKPASDWFNMPSTPCGERAKAYGDKVAGDRSASSAEEWDRLGRDCIERRAYTDGIRTYRRALALHPELAARLTNLAAVSSESGQHELAYCLTPRNKHLKKAWERTKRTARLCPETDKKGVLFVPADLP